MWSAITGDAPSQEIDLKALAQIGLYVKEHHLAMLERCESAKAAWEKLEALFQSKNNARKLQLRKELAQIRMAPTEPLTKYAARAKEIQDQLRAAGHEVSDQEVAWSVLAGLPSAFDMVVTVLETTDEDMTLDNILPKLLQAERQQENKQERFFTSMTETALAAKRYNKTARNGNYSQQTENKNRTCYVCGEPGHIARDCTERRNQQRYGGRTHFAIAL